MSTWIWLGVGAVGIAAAVFVVQRAGAAQRRGEPSGLPWFLRRPNGLAEAQATFASAQRGREEAKQWSEQQVASAVRRYVLDLAHSADASGDLAGRIRQQCERAAHEALLLLRDGSLRQRLGEVQGSRTSTTSLTETPAQRACELLSDHPTPAAIPELTHWVRHPHDGTRKHAAVALAVTGEAAAVPGLEHALADADHYVRSYVVTGLRRAEDARRLAPELRQRLLQPLLGAALRHDDDKAAALAARWDASRARDVFRSHGLLAPGAPFRGAAMALDALTGAGAALPRDEVLTLWAGRPRGDEYREQCFRAALVRMLAAHRDPADHALLAELLGADERTADAAAAATMERLGLGDLESRLHRKRFEERVPLNAAEGRHAAMRSFDNEVCNGGFDQFFFNSSGDDWEAALDGFTAHDAGRAALLRDAVGRFGDAPSRDRAVRAEQLEALHARRERPFDDLDRRYYGDGDRTSIEVVLVRHALAHADELRRAR